MIKRIVQAFSGLPGTLRRITSGAGFIPEIDGLRFLAIFPVVLQHYSERINNISNKDSEGNPVLWILSHGHIGVYIFFAISGFILALPFGKENLLHGRPVSLKQYYTRRVTRIEPPYLVVMTLLFVVLLVVKHVSFSDMFPHYLASLLYVHRLVFDSWTPINPPAWTLEVEVQFYLIAPFLTAFYFKIRKAFVRRSILITLVVAKVLVANTTTLFDTLYLTLPFLIEYFCVGILVADVFLTELSGPSKSNHGFYDFLALVSISALFCSWTWDKNITWKFVFLASLFGTFYCIFRGNVVRRFFQLPWITAIGGMCYSIYLLHLAFAESFVAVLNKVSPFHSYLPNFALGLPFFLLLLFAISVVFFKLIEQPCMDPEWPRKLWQFAQVKLRIKTQN